MNSLHTQLNRPATVAAVALALLTLTASAAAQTSIDDTTDFTLLDGDDFTSMSIEQLMNIQVTSVAGTTEPWFTTPAAMYVITGEDVRRSGHRSLADALRLAPGLSVRQLNASTWSISSRGFDSRFANKLLVLIDGRSVYHPLFSGVFWDVQDVLMEDLDRIEVIRGPGATLWGANAVNGVINVTTKSAKETQGLYITGGNGTEERGFGAVRYGGQFDDHTWFRVWSKYFNRDDMQLSGGDRGHDDWDFAHGGLRIDRDLDDQTSLTLQGEFYHSGRLGESVSLPLMTPLPSFTTVNGDGRISGGHLLARLGRERDAANGWTLQAYIDRTERKYAAEFEVNRTSLDVDFRHRFEWTDRHDLIWGLGFRHTSDQTAPNGSLAFSPSDRKYQTFSGFIQDTIDLVPEQLAFMAGTKIEHNSFTGFEIQPSARLSWTPTPRQTLWGAVSRPVRVPSRTEEDIRLITFFIDSGIAGGGPPSGIIIPVGYSGDTDIDSEELTAYEIGYRARPSDNLTIDLAAFFNDYRRLQMTPLTPIATFDNLGSAESYGFEIAGTWKVSDNWRLDGSYSFVRLLAHGPVSNTAEEGTPRNQFQLHSMLDITQDLELNTALYYADNIADEDVPWYFRLDAGLTWRPTDRLEIALWGQNLLDSSRREASDATFQPRPAEVERGVYLQATLRF